MSRFHPIRSSKLIRAILRIGFRLIRQKGSHVFLKHPDGRSTVVPVHKGEDIGRGLLRKILQDIEMNWEEFEKHL